MDGSAVGLYNDTTYYDDLIFAATWLYKASGDNAYLTDAEAFYVKYLYGAVGLSANSPTLLAHSLLHVYIWAGMLLLLRARACSVAFMAVSQFLFQRHLPRSLKKAINQPHRIVKRLCSGAADSSCNFFLMHVSWHLHGFVGVQTDILLLNAGYHCVVSVPVRLDGPVLGRQHPAGNPHRWRHLPLPGSELPQVLDLRY